MSFPYTTVLVMGATSGIGLALAEKMISNGTFVIAVGRRQDRLDSFVQKHGKDKVSSIQFDITDLAGMPQFAASVTKAHPKLDCIFLNSGVQRPLDFTKPESIDLTNVSAEINTNYLSHIHMITHFLPFLQKQTSPASLIFTTSGLALLPIPLCPNYCATKAAMHQLILTLRVQLEKSNVKVVEILPPAVRTELHDKPGEEHTESKFGMLLEDFTNDAWEGLCEGKTDIPVGTSKEPYEEGGWETRRQESFKEKLILWKKVS